MYILLSFIRNAISYPMKIYNLISSVIDFFNRTIQIIIRFRKISIIIFTLMYKMYKLLINNSFKRNIKLIRNKISEKFHTLFTKILVKIGLFKKVTEEENDKHLKELIKNIIFEEKINIKFDDIIELDEAKDIIMESIIFPKYLPNFYKGLREPFKGILLFGPPGAGKTLLAKSIASEIAGGFFNVKASFFTSKWVEEKEKLVKILFEMAKEISPSIIFIDEIDSIVRIKEKNTHSYDIRILNEFLIQIDRLNLNDNVLVVATTNKPFDLDEVILRRFQKAIYIPLPSKEGRKKMFKLFMKNNEYESCINFDKLAEITEGYNGTDIYNLCKESTYVTLRKIVHDYKKNNSKIDREIFKQEKIQNKLISPISYNDILYAFKNSKKSVSKESIEQYEKFLRKIS